MGWYRSTPKAHTPKARFLSANLPVALFLDNSGFSVMRPPVPVPPLLSPSCQISHNTGVEHVLQVTRLSFARQQFPITAGPSFARSHREAPKRIHHAWRKTIMELKALFWIVIIAGLLAAGGLLFVVREQMDNRRANGAGAETDSVCLTCDSRP